MKQDQKRFLKSEIGRLANAIGTWQFPAEKEPPASVKKAMDAREKAAEIVDQWEEQERARRSAIQKDFYARLRELRKLFAFGDAEEALKACEALAADIEKHK